MLEVFTQKHVGQSDSSITPVVAAIRLVHVALCDPLKIELNKLQVMNGVAQVEEPIDWVNNVIVETKTKRRWKNLHWPTCAEQGSGEGNLPATYTERHSSRTLEGACLPYFTWLKSPAQFESWEFINEGIPLGSDKDHQGSIGGVEASIIEVVLDGISPSSFGATSWSFPTMDVWLGVIDSSYWERGWHAKEMSEPAKAVLS